ncbi:MAG: hypothetical protein IH627_14215 [Rubrivivax sp.]|nr:hypothetical protein [Rubrivivax sp.]
MPIGLVDYGIDRGTAPAWPEPAPRGVVIRAVCWLLMMGMVMSMAGAGIFR